jgi:cytochrome c-type biogenesis protein CcmH/NrfG
VEGAKVVLEFLGGITRKTETSTNKKGEFTQVGLQPGNYRVSASKEGFPPQAIELRISLGDATTVPEIKLIPAAKAGGAAQQEAASKEMQASFDKAMKATEAGQFDEAEAAFKDVLAKNPSRPEIVWTQLGAMYVKKKDAAAAEDAFRKAIEAKPDYDPAYSGLASLLIGAGQGPKAVETLAKAATDFPQDAKVQFVHAWTLFATGQSAEAEAAFKKVAAMDPDNPEVYFFLGSIAVGQNKLAEAVSQLEKYVSMKPGNPTNLATAQGLLAALKPKK